MPQIPSDIAPILEKLGIRNPAENKWKQREAWPSRLRAHAYCKAGHPSTRVELASTMLRERPVFIGQCAQCGLVIWRQAEKDERPKRGR